MYTTHTYIHALTPFSPVYTTGATANGEAWWVDRVPFSQRKTHAGPAIYMGIEESISAMDEVFATQGPFHGCLAFSQVKEKNFFRKNISWGQRSFLYACVYVFWLGKRERRVRRQATRANIK